MRQLLGACGDEESEFDEWLTAQDSAGPGFVALGCGIDDSVAIQGDVVAPVPILSSGLSPVREEDLEDAGLHALAAQVAELRQRVDERYSDAPDDESPPAAAQGAASRTGLSPALAPPSFMERAIAAARLANGAFAAVAAGGDDPFTTPSTNRQNTPSTKGRKESPKNRLSSAPLVKSTASLSEILLSIKSAKDSEPQDRPVGYAILGWHVDDALGLSCCVGWDRNIKTNRVIQYIKGMIEVTYATTLTGWHGNKSLGFTLTLDEVNERVSMSARDTLEQLGTELLKSVVRVAPKHVVTNEFYDIPAGALPSQDDPQKDQVLADMALCRHASCARHAHLGKSGAYRGNAWEQ
jgi:hypothetical protein